MLDWIGHQLAVWRYGAGVLLLLAVPALWSGTVGSFIATVVGWIFSQEFSAGLWLICSLAVAPFFLPSLARHIADMVRSDPPPRSGDLLRKRMHEGKI
jgi:hypothetical protein